MTTPIVTEIPSRVELAMADSFLFPSRAKAAPLIRELDHRRNDGIDVRLLWNQTDDRVVVTVSDGKTGDAFAFPVEPRDALTAFHHPYAYAREGGPNHMFAV